MPMQRERYPNDWPAISARIRARAAGRCEWCQIDAGSLTTRGARVVLTVHHIGITRPDGRPGDRRDKRDCRDENLVALCQRCHLNADRDLHLAHAAANRRRRRIDAGQLELEIR
jgi:hypothetical protein